MASILVPHFRTHLRKTRAGQYDLQRILGDICDYGVDNARNIIIQFKFDSANQIERIVYHNDGEGFQNLNKQGAENPMNFGYENQDIHGHDDHESTFGGGTKDAWISCANLIQMVTKVNPSSIVPTFKEVQFDVNEMRAAANPVDSYMPEIKQITKRYFECKTSKYNVPTQGTLVVLSQLEANYKRHVPEGSREQYIDEIISILNRLYWKKLAQTKATIEVRVDGCLPMLVEGKSFYTDSSFVSHAEITTVINVILIDDVETEVLYEISYYKTTDDVQRDEKSYRYFYKNNADDSQEKLGDGNRGRDKFMTRINSYKRENPDTYDEIKLVMVSRALKSHFSTSPHISKARNTVNVYRNGRFYGAKRFCKRTLNETSSNCIYNELVYSSKKINPLLGVRSNKTIDTSMENTSILAAVLRKTTNTYKGKFWLGNVREGRLCDFINYENTIPELAQPSLSSLASLRPSRRDFVEELKMKYDAFFQNEHYRDYTRMEQFDAMNQTLFDLYYNVEQEKHNYEIGD